MNLVGHARVCDHAVELNEVSDEEMRRLAECGQDDATPEGLTKIEEGIIYFRKTSYARTQDTIAHEIGHYLVDASGIRKFFEATIKTDDYAQWEEQAIAMLVPQILAVRLVMS